MDIVEEYDGLHFKGDLAKRNWPDRFIFLPGGKMVIVEFKRPGEEPRPAQEALHRQLADIGFEVHVIDRVSQFRQLLLEQLQSR